METESTYSIELITRYLAGEACGDDLVFLEAWLKADPGNRKVFEDYRRVWLKMEQAQLEDNLKMDAAWQDMERLLDNGQRNVKRSVPLHYRQVFRIAAVIILLLIPSFFLFRYLTRPVQTRMQAALTIKEGHLPDGTSVTLNKGAALDYPTAFKGNKRIVKLRGEAYFEVKHDDAKPFIVYINNVRVEVLGTTFYVNTLASGNSMEVILNSGSVAIYFDDQKEKCLFLSPGEKAEILPGEQKMGKDINTDQNYRAWMTQRFVYNNVSLGTIVADLNKVYDANLSIVSPAIADCLVTATFDHQSPESILRVLGATLDLTISTRGNLTEISGHKCN